jgi:predicted acetyltransferase
MPAPNTAIRRAVVADRVPIFRMLELYQHDLSDIWDQDLGADGEFGYELNRYWSSERCHSFVATVADNYAGFALVDRNVKVGTAGYWMDQFFVMKKYRRSGVGSALARGAFSALPGAWEVGEMLNNHGAQSFLAQGRLPVHRWRLRRAQANGRCVGRLRPMLPEDRPTVTPNPSVKPTRSGLRPPRAAYLIR